MKLFSSRFVFLFEPAKDAIGVAQGIIDNAGGETDVEVTFPINVE